MVKEGEKSGEKLAANPKNIAETIGVVKSQKKEAHDPPKTLQERKALTAAEQKKIAEAKAKAREAFDQLKQGQRPILESEFTSEDIVAARREIKEHRETVEATIKKAGLVSGELPQDETALAVLYEIASAPQELRDDPYWLTVKAAVLREGLADLPVTEQKIIGRLLGEIERRVEEEFGVDLEERRSAKKGRTSCEIAETSVKDRLVAAETAANILLPEAGATRGASSGSPPADWLRFSGQPSTPIDNQDLKNIVDQLRAFGESADWRRISSLYVELGLLRSSLKGSDRVWADGLHARVYEVFSLANGDRFTLTPALITELTTGPQAASARDRAFYERIKKILENPNEESRHQLNLYDQADIDAFMFVVGSVVDPATGAPIGRRLVQHYQNLMESLIRLSDLEYWARHSAGDVESLAKAVNFVENKFAIEALADPLVEDMFQCYEQAIKILRDSNDQYILSELARYDPIRYDTFIDQLTLRLFRQRVDAGAVRDYQRDEQTGLPLLDSAYGENKFLRSDRPFHFTGATEEEIELRLLATLRMAKGIAVLTNRGVELFAFTRTPGTDVARGSYADQPFEQTIAVFSSKVMGGLTRWTNPLSEWFRMYGFGDILFVPFFNALIGGPKAAEGRALSWTLDQCREAMAIADTGDIDLLRERFGDGVVRLMDMIEEMSFSGREGPLSMWGTLDETQGWTHLDYERLGGSMRLTLAGRWADKAVFPRFEAEGIAKGWSATKIKEEWARAKLGEESWASDLRWKEALGNYERTYKTWIWTQMVLRNAQGVASHVWARYQSTDGQWHRGKLRSKIFHEIFTADDLCEFTISGRALTDLAIERDVAIGHEITGEKLRLLQRIAVLDGDLAAVQRYAANSEERPRDVTLEDFTQCIRGDYTLDLGSGRRVVISEARRREQAIAYWQTVQREILGKALGDAGPGWDAHQWQQELQPAWTNDHQLQFLSPDSINDVFRRAQSASKHRLTQELVDKRILVHFGTEDVQWHYLDLNSLGDRHWGRRGNDNLTRAKTIMLLMKHFHLLTGKAKEEDLIRSLATIGQQEKDHDPKEAAKFVSLWAVATNNIYRQRLGAGIPFLGRILPLLGIPNSIAQERLGVHSAKYWSMNNQLKFFDDLGETRVIPERRVMDGTDYGPYTMKETRKNAGISRVLAILEAGIIGYVLTSVLMGFAGFTTEVKEESK